jgi:AcrR family transcriptional regulator
VVTRTRLTAEVRQAQIIAAAVTAFSLGGYAGTTTDQVARLAGVTQPYVIRLFGTKQQLFLAALAHAASRIEQTFRAAAAKQPDLASLAAAYQGLVPERELVTVLLHGFAASADPAIGAVVRECFGSICSTVRELTGEPPGKVRDFMAAGVLLTILGAIRVIGPGAVPAEEWMIGLVEGMNLNESLLGPVKSHPSNKS